MIVLCFVLFFGLFFVVVFVQGFEDDVVWLLQQVFVDLCLLGILFGMVFMFEIELILLFLGDFGDWLLIFDVYGDFVSFLVVVF